MNDKEITKQWEASLYKYGGLQMAMIFDFARAIENATIERCAVVTESEIPWGNMSDDWAAECLHKAAAAIRAMKGGE